MFLCNSSLENNRKIIMKKGYWLIIIWILFPLVSSNYAQETPLLITDRPSKTESAVTIPFDYVQIETGFIYQNQKYSEGANSIENENLILASTLCRYGVNTFIELRFGGEYFYGQTFTNGFKSDLQGVHNLLFGGKIQLRKNKKILSNVGVILQTIIPFGNKELRTDNFSPILFIAIDQKIEEGLKFGLNLGTKSIDNSGKYSSIYSGSLAYNVNDRLALFLELFGNARIGLSPSNNWDCGITYQFKSNIQVDFSLGTTLMKGITDLFGGFGISVRLPE